MARLPSARPRPAPRPAGRPTARLRVLELEDRAAPSVNLVADINREPRVPAEPLLELGGAAYFNRQTDAGPALWRTDGTAGGSAPVAAVRAESISALGGALYVVGTAADGTRGLWRSDGTPEGTTLVKPLRHASLAGAVAAGGRLYFTGGGAVNELWRTDGTARGTVRVRAFPHDGSSPLGKFAPTPVGNRALFWVEPRPTDDDPAPTPHLWSTDGTPAGTRRLSTTAFRVVGLGGRAYFAALESIPGPDGYDVHRLYRTDGTRAGTARFAEFVGAVEDLSAAGGALYFRTDAEPYGTELWTSDGTAAGTRLVRDVYLGERSGTGPGPAVAWGQAVYFVGDEGVGGPELWRTDGTAAGTRLVKDVRPGPDGSVPTLAGAVGVGPDLYFTADDGAGGRELWRTDGTEAGTVRVADVEPGPAGPALGSFVPVGDALYFTADTAAGGREVWVTDGTGPGTAQVVDAEAGPGGSFPVALTAVGPRLVWANNTLAGGAALWAVSGPAGGPIPLAPVPPQTLDGGGAGGVDFAGRYYFPSAGTGHPDETGAGLWVTDGTAAGTRLVKAIPGAGGLTVVNGAVYFLGTTPDAGTELWVSDGTEAGTRMVRDLAPGPAGSFPTDVAGSGGRTFFLADTGAAGGWQELWATDGTEAGTVFLRGFPDVYIADLTAVGGGVYFTTDRWGFPNTKQVWRSDGTPGGTVVLKDFGEHDGLFTSHFAGLADRVVFADPQSGWWVTDGTPAGTAPFPVRGIGLPGFARFGDQYYFWADDGIHGVELWRTDGTDAGTALAVDTVPGPAGAGPIWGVVAGEVLIYSDGPSLRRTDGTAAGTFPLLTIRPDAGDIVYPPVVGPGGRLHFLAYTRARGSELWTTDGTPDGTAAIVTLSPQYRAQELFSGTGLTAVGGRLYFGAITAFADGQPDRSALYVSDGTAAGTHPVLDQALLDRFLGDLGGGSLLLAFRFPDAGQELGRYDPLTAAPDGYALEDGLVLDVPAAQGVLANDADGPGGTRRPAAAVLAAGPAHGWLDLRPDGSFTYQPYSRDFSGTDAFAYRATAGGDEPGPVTVTILVDLVNRAPAPADDAAAGKAGTAVRIKVLGNDLDPDHDPLTVAGFTQGSAGKVRRVGDALVYTPAARGMLTDTFTYTVRDARGATGTATVTVHLSAPAPPRVVSVRVFNGQAAAELVGRRRSGLPFPRLTAVEIRFSADVAVAADDLRLVGAGAGAFALTGFRYDPATRTAAWAVAGPTGSGMNDEVRVLLEGSAGGVTSAADSPIGDWSRTVGVLTGDVDGNGLVTPADAAGVRRRLGVGRPGNWFADVDGSGVIDAADLRLVAAHLGRRRV